MSTDAQVTSGGRSLSRENITTGHVEEPVRFYRVSDPPIFAGFRTGWVSGEDEDTGMRFDLSAGAGLGSPYMTLTVELPDGTTVYEYVDITEVLQVRVAAIVAEHDQPESAVQG